MKTLQLFLHYVYRGRLC